MLKNISNLGKTLSRLEQKVIVGGRKSASLQSDNEDGPCCISSNHGGFNDCGYSVSQAQNLYNQEFTVGDSTVTGYCCASC